MQSTALGQVRQHGLGGSTAGRVTYFGLEGAAMAWVLRVTADAVGLFAVAAREVPAVRSLAGHALVATAAAGALVLAAACTDSVAAGVALVAAAGCASLWLLMRMEGQRAALATPKAGFVSHDALDEAPLP